MIQPGTYAATVTFADLGETSTGKEQVAIGLRTIETSEMITWYGYFTDKALKITMAALRACGWVGDDVTDLGMTEGTEVEIVVEHEDYQGNTTARVRWINKPGGGRLNKPLNDGQRQSLRDRLKGKVLAAMQQEKAEKEIDTDDLPF